MFEAHTCRIGVVLCCVVVILNLYGLKWRLVYFGGVITLTFALSSNHLSDYLHVVAVITLYIWPALHALLFIIDPGVSQ